MEYIEQAESQKKPFEWRALTWAFLFFWYFSAVNQALIYFSGTAGFEGLRNSFYLSLLWLIPFLLIPRYAKSIAAVIGIMLWATSLGSLGYFIIYQQEFSQSVIFIMFESNTAETSEYISQYFNFTLLGILIAYSIVGILLWRKLKPVYLPNKAVTYSLCLGILICVMGYPYFNRMVNKNDTFPMATEKVLKRMEPAVPWQLVVGYYQYQKQLASMQRLLDTNASLPPIANLQDANGDTPRTLVLVIGESTTSQHMSLYGYGRETTPLLEKIAETDQGLTVFNDVVAARPYTIEMLQQALTFADQQNPERYLSDPSLINIMKQAGYKTFWITNQQTMTKRNTMLTTFSQIADEQFYLNNQRNQNALQHDEVVFEPFEKVLNDPAEKKFIVVHLLGTHMNYKYRYPDEFKKFEGRDEVVPASLSNREVAIYNSYDNAVLYNDYVVATLIKQFAATDPYGFLVYFSDHGEEVFGDPKHEVLGRNEEAPTMGMYKVPFMVWNSPSWQQTHALDLKQLVDRPYSLSHLIHTWSDLAGLSYDMYMPNRSLVSPDFVAETRWIGNPAGKIKSYDKLFPKKLAKPVEVVVAQKEAAKDVSN